MDILNIFVPLLLVALAPESQQQSLCRYRDYPAYEPALFAQFAGWGCYQYGPDTRFASKLTTGSCYYEDNTAYPCIMYVDLNNVPQYVDYNPNNETARQIVAASFSEDRFFQNWLDCCEAAEECCSNVNNDTDGYCPHTWDGWQCWTSESPETIQKQPCPSYAYTSTPPTCTYYATKLCFPNGTWVVSSDYGGCNTVPDRKSRILFQVSMLGISIGCVLPAIIICFSYRKLRVLRVALHRNLMCAIITRSALTISIKAGVILEALLAVNEEDTILEGNGAGCKILAVIEKVAGNAVFACMLMESIFLHRMIAAAMRGEPKMKYYFIGATGVVCIPVLAWSISRAVVDDTDCWMVDSSLQWINDGPRIALLVVNTLLLLDIIRVLLTKLRHVSTAKSGYIRRTAKATLMLAPVFGINILLTAYRPQPKSCVLEQTYYFISYFMEGLQGCIVALLYCYLNKEVQSLLHRTFMSVKIHVFKFFHCNAASERARQELQYLMRRATLSTNADGWQESRASRVTSDFARPSSLAVAKLTSTRIPSPNGIPDTPDSPKSMNQGRLTVTFREPNQDDMSFEDTEEIQVRSSDTHPIQLSLTPNGTVQFSEV